MSVLASAVMLAVLAAGCGDAQPMTSSTVSAGTGASGSRDGAAPRSTPDPAASGVEVLDVPSVPDDAIDVPPGAVVAETAWRDAVGEHRVLLAEDVDARAPDAAGSVVLTAVHYLAPTGAPATAVLAGQDGSESPPCPAADLADRFYPSSLQVSDVDRDGVGEAVLLRATGCVTDVVGVVTAVMFTGEDTYAVSGSRPTVGGLPPTVGEPAEIDASVPDQLRPALVDAWASELPGRGDAGDARPAALTSWAGDYVWAESVPADGGARQTAHYDLRVEEVDDRTLAGRLTVTGFRDDVVVDLAVLPNQGSASPDTPGPGIRLVVDEVVRRGSDAPSPYEPGDVLLDLQGDPLAPVTVIRELRSLVDDLPSEGSYFVRADAGGEPVS